MCATIQYDSTVWLNFVDHLKNLRANLGSSLKSRRSLGTWTGSKRLLIWGSSHRSFLTTLRIQSLLESRGCVLVTKGYRMTQRKLVSQTKGQEIEEDCCEGEERGKQGLTWRGNLRLTWMKLRREQSILRKKCRANRMSLIVLTRRHCITQIFDSTEEEGGGGGRGK